MTPSATSAFPRVRGRWWQNINNPMVTGCLIWMESIEQQTKYLKFGQSTLKLTKLTIYWESMPQCYKIYFVVLNDVRKGKALGLKPPLWMSNLH